MKFKVIFIAIILLLIAISCSRFNNYYNSNIFFSITKIDSINNYYLIYALKKDTLVKIVSKKDKLKLGEKIKVGNFYNFNLESMAKKTPVVNGIQFSTINDMDVNCFKFDNQTIICKESNVYGVYTTNNLIGLYFTR